MFKNSVDNDKLPDMVIIGLQEVTTSPVQALSNFIAGERWSKAIKDNLGGKYKKVSIIYIRVINDN